MHIYFKMRNPEDLISYEQEAFITRYVSTLCHLEKYGVVHDDFIEHRTTESKTAGQLFVLGSYYVSPEADFDKIEKKIKTYNLHEHFVIFCLF